eukprot:TRINITY_DN13892_c0_g1_i1.p1 TRINITY_DN13892_c0_g1~~TRINITY_DN13892_c0_g1_i1.p1  ORF type:complete len:636 (+),score=195.90 TRINITY_DN13892_c0_g1_i1:49-1908(+)
MAVSETFVSGAPFRFGADAGSAAESRRRERAAKLLPRQWSSLRRVPDEQLERWLVDAGAVAAGSHPNRAAMQRIYAAEPSPLVARHQFLPQTVQYDRPCAACSSPIPAGTAHASCRRCSARAHLTCAKRLHVSHRRPVREEQFRYSCHSRVCGRGVVQALGTGVEDTDPFRVYHGQRVRSLRGTARGREGTVVGACQGRLYMHWDGDVRATALYAGSGGTPDVEELQRCHGLMVLGACTSEARDASRDDVLLQTYDSTVSSGGSDNWHRNPKGLSCSRCGALFSQLTRCDACGVIDFRGREYPEPQWPELFADDQWRLYMASHDGERETVHGAAELGEAQDVRVLCTVGGYDVDAHCKPKFSAYSEGQRTPMMLAVLRCLHNPGWHKSVAVRLREDLEAARTVRVLCKLGAGVNKADSGGRTALHLAAEFMSPYPLPVDEGSYLGRDREVSVQQLAHEWGHLRWPAGFELLCELLRCGADTSATTRAGDTALELAAAALSQHPPSTRRRLSALLSPHTQSGGREWGFLRRRSRRARTDRRSVSSDAATLRSAGRPRRSASEPCPAVGSRRESRVSSADLQLEPPARMDSFSSASLRTPSVSMSLSRSALSASRSQPAPS